MSKVVLYVMDTIVWTLLIAAITAQALQFAGVVNSPKLGLTRIYDNPPITADNEYTFPVQAGEESNIRSKRQLDKRSEFIDSLFNKQFGQGDYFFRIDRTKVIVAKE